MIKKILKSKITIVVLFVIFIVMFLIGMGDAIQRITVLENQIEYLNEQEPDTKTEVVEVYRQEIPIKGEKGERGEAGEIPEGHWKKYCIYNKNQMGYPTKGVMLRKDSRNGCDDAFEVIELWEK